MTLRTLGAIIVPAISGCLLENHPELLVFNQRNEPVGLSISMRRVSDESEVYSETFRLAADEDVRRQVDLSTDPHRITTVVERGPERTYEWTPGGEGCCIEVHIEDDAIEHHIRAY